MKIIINVDSLGDLLNLTPIVRKLSKEACKKTNERLQVYCKNSVILKNNPYCEVYELEDDDIVDDPNEDVFRICVDNQNQFLFRETNQISSMKYGGNHLVDYQSFQMGFSLPPKDKTLDYFPDESDVFDRFSIPDKYVVFNTSLTWPSRTWARENWQELITLCNDNGIFTVLVGKGMEDAPPDYIDAENAVGTITGLNIGLGLDLQNETSLDDLWHLLNRANYIVCTDSGILHFSGTTDSNIVMIPGSIDPYHRLPFRNGSQDTKTTVIYGDCTIFCASNIGYNKNVGGSVRSSPKISRCLEGYDEFTCHSTVQSVFSALSFPESTEIVRISNDEKIGIGVNVRFEDFETHIKNTIVKATDIIFLTFWDFIGHLEIKFIDTAGVIENTLFSDVEVNKVIEQWFKVRSTFENYNDLKIEIRNSKDGELLYEKVLK